jgi:DNA adenine methylase
MKPIIKWVGGKTQCLEHIREKLPQKYDTYYEPFLGGAAVLLNLNPTKAVVNDINSELINMYLQVKYQPENVIKFLTSLDNGHEVSEDPKAYYYSVREVFNENLSTDSAVQAARFIYLNKHCFNGLYRVNKKGEFNVPFNGKLSGWSADPDHLREVSTKLKDVDIRCGDYVDAVKDASKEDFIFFDSPYAPITPTSFTDYTKEGFSYEDHVRLSDLFKELTNRGCYCMLTNHDTDLIRELYKDFKFTEVDVRRSINRKGDRRTGKEVIITNYNISGGTYNG